MLVKMASRLWKCVPLIAFSGGVFFIRILGPMLGFLLGSVCNRLYYNLKADPEVEPTDVNWIGAWWLGFLAIAVVLFIPSLMLFFFPHVELTSLENKPDQSSSTVAVQQKRSVTVKAVSDRKPLSVCSSIAAELKILFESLWLMIRLPVYTLCMIGRMLDVLAFKGFFVFHSKYLQAHYSLPQYKANAAMGLAGSFGFALGNVAGGVIMRKMKLEGRRAVVYVLVCGVISVLFSFVKLTLGCTSTLSQLGSLGRENGFNFTTSCNRHCHCDNSMLLPVCSSSGTPYFSPCHAGCQSSQRVGSLTNFTDCFCMDNGTIASRDFCRDDCDQPLVSYLLLWTVTGIIAGTAMVPGLLIVLRSVPARLKSLSLGFNAFLVSLLSTLPSPILYGYVIDGTCLLWSESCGQKGSCSIYDTDELRLRQEQRMAIKRTERYFSLHGGLRALAVLLDIAVFYFAKDLKILEDSNVKKAKSAPSITDSSDDVRKTSTHSEQRQEAETKDSNGSLQQPEQKAPNSCCTNL
ncbi:sodium-independent organic anion transporter [Trichuris suis]|nr:sodium-independent organic anion transporter [Trichuris suis]